MFDRIPTDENNSSLRQYCQCQEKRQPPTGTFPKCSALTRVRSPSIIPTLDVTSEYKSVQSPRMATIPPGRSQHRPSQGSRSRTQTQRRVTHPQRRAKSREKRQGGHHNVRNPTYYNFPEDHSSNSQEALVPSWPTESGLNEPEARRLCEETLRNSAVGTGCRRLLRQVLVQAVEMCVMDQQLKDDRAWLSATVPLLENECERRVIEEVSRRKELKDVQAVLRCPSMCSGNGQCTEWGCSCFPGFASYDCSRVSGEWIRSSHVHAI